MSAAQIPSLETRVLGVVQCWRSFNLTVYQGNNNYKDYNYSRFCCEGAFQISVRDLFST